jgi:hypothetical protein
LNNGTVDLDGEEKQGYTQGRVLTAGNIQIHN